MSGEQVAIMVVIAGLILAVMWKPNEPKGPRHT